MKAVKIEDTNISGDLGVAAEKMAAQYAKEEGTLLNKDLLPSRGKYYPNDIRVKKLSTIDIKNLSTVTQDNVNNILNTVISKNVLGVNVNDVFVGDKLWLIFYLRSITYNDYPFLVKYNCDACRHSGLHEFKLADIQVNYLSDDFNDQFTTNDGDIITLTFPTIGNENNANRLKKEDQFAEFDGDLIDIANYIKAVNGKNLTLRSAYEYLISMDPIDFAKFTNMMGNSAFGIKPTYDISCSCGNTITEKIVFSPDFFMPDFSKTR